MNFSEFKKLIGADPGNSDPDTLRARHSAPEFEAAAIEAEVFEKKLQGALHIRPPADLLSQLQNISHEPARKRHWIPLALAASFLVFVGAAGVVWKQTHHWDSVESYVAEHYSHDGNKVLNMATEKMSDKDIAKILARLNATADKQLAGLITFIKFCPTPNGRGAHMVVTTDQGPMTIIYMPDVQVADGEMVKFNQMHALLVNLESGSAAIIGAQSQNVENLVVMVRDSLKTGQSQA
ncbi:MAG: DUF3379 family protein [Lysobacterales bacterium]